MSVIILNHLSNFFETSYEYSPSFGVVKFRKKGKQSAEPVYLCKCLFINFNRKN